MATSAVLNSGDVLTVARLTALRDDILSVTTGHVHDGTNGRSTFAGLALAAQNTTDAISNQVGKFGGGNRGTPADNDEAYFSFELDNHLGAQTEFVRFTWKALDVTNTSKDSRPEWQYYTANTLRELVGPAITADDTICVLSLAQTLANKTLTTPTISSTGFANANHAHAAANSGGQLGMAGLSEVAVARKSADQTVNNSSTLQNDDHLFFSVGANETWMVLVVLDFVTDATADFRSNFSVPSGASGRQSVMGRDTVSNLQMSESAIPGNLAYAGSAGPTRGTFMLQALIRTAGTAGTVTFQWAQGAATVVDTVAKQESSLVGFKVA